MPIRAHCPSCQAQYTLVDSLRGKYVRCERCHQSFRAVPSRLEEQGELPAKVDLPPISLTPPSQAGVPLTIVNTGERDAEKIPTPARPRPTPSSGAGKAGFPIGVIFLLFFAIRACTSLTTSHSYDRPRYETPTPVPKFNDKLPFRVVKDKDIVVDPEKK
jgi:predicted Zn finger-like uncharacterized protein